MSTWNFDEMTSRRGSGCYKWDVDPYDDVLPMWVADMDFKTAPEITQSVIDRAAQGIFGYTKVSDAFYDAITNWYSRRYGSHVEKNWILYTSGVVPALSAIIKALTSPLDEVVVLTPVYNCFFSSIRNNDCNPVEVPLMRHGDSYEIDFEAFERAVARDRAKLFLLCNPHNPAGRAWSKAELRKLGEACRRHSVTVVSDEIHSGIIMPGNTFTPYINVGSDLAANSVTTSSSSKSFNTAGLQVSYIFSPREGFRKAIDRALNINEVCDVNPFGVEALVTAYNKCEPWLDDLCRYIYGNYELLKSFVDKELPELSVLRLEATYLAWIDIRRTGMSSSLMSKKLLDNGLRLSPGNIYGNAGEGYMRINLATQRSRVEEGLRRLKKALKG
ncbi:MAG: pyridoxal phosphate-dependent aminotransferase [Bacteroidales bacterium]|nr:pyridoxal phosphate-dependent aminotransferase [Bacteroidales bacterium]